jgi:hypothetical protein
VFAVGWFEWFGESCNPGPVGDVDMAPPSCRPRNPVVVAILFLVAVGLLGGWLAWLWTVVPSLANFTLAVCATLAYLRIGYFVQPRPDMTNIGLLGGLIDHPFRYSDDLNRLLIFLWIILWPGRALTSCLVNPWLLARDQEEAAREQQEEQRQEQMHEDLRRAFKI